MALYLNGLNTIQGKIYCNPNKVLEDKPTLGELRNVSPKERRPHLIQVFILKPPSLWTALIWLFISPLLTVSKPHLSKLLLEPNFTICPSASFPKILKYYQNLIKQFIIFIFLVKSSYSRTTTSVEPSKVCHPYITVGKSSFMNSSYMFSKLLFISVVFPANIT